MSRARARGLVEFGALPKLFLPSLAVGWAASCAVFPDEAVLPGGEAGAAAGDAGGAQAGAVAAGGAPAAAGSRALAGELNQGGAPLTMGGAPDSPGGAPNECAEPREIVRDGTADTWIEEAMPGVGHGNDEVLYVDGGVEEQRTLVQFSLPVRQVGTSLIRATVRLRLQENADVMLAERHLEMSQLEQEVDTLRATWNNWGNGGNRQWQMAGGDFGLPLASATIPAQTAEGWVSFDVTAAVDEALSTTSTVPFPLIVLEVGPAPTPPSVLAFTSTEGDDLEDPELLIEYCQ